MTPKEKAKELVYKFYPSVQWKLGQEDCLNRAKQCALIAINEMTKYIPNVYHDDLVKKKYWKKVKKEIELL